MGKQGGGRRTDQAGAAAAPGRVEGEWQPQSPEEQDPEGGGLEAELGGRGERGEGSGCQALPAPGEVDRLILSPRVVGGRCNEEVRPWRDVETLLGEENGASLQGRKAADVAGAALELSKSRLTQCTVTGEGCRHAVSPGSEIGCGGVRSCSAET